MIRMDEIDALITLSSNKASPQFVSAAKSIVDLLKENDRLSYENSCLSDRLRQEEERTKWDAYIANIFSNVAEKQRSSKIYEDDQDTLMPILDSLSPEELDIWIKEVEVSESLYKEHGFLNVTADMLERAFINAGLEKGDLQ